MSQIDKTDKPWIKISLGVMTAITTLIVGYWQFGQPPKDDRKDLSGRVVDKITQKAIRGAEVSLEASSLPDTVPTDSDGVFLFPIKTPDKPVRIRVRARGYEEFNRQLKPSAKEGLEEIQLTPASPAPKESPQSADPLPPSKPVIGTDPDGLSATFIFHQLLYDYGWEIGESSKIKDFTNGHVSGAVPFLKGKIAQPEISKRIGSYSDLIAVGSASCEGFDRVLEERRAEERSKVIRRALAETVGGDIKGQLYILLLGQYNDKSCSERPEDDRAGQRRLVIIGVKEADKGVNLRLAVKDAVNKSEKLFRDELSQYLKNPGESPLGYEVLLSNYSKFDLRIE